MTEEIIFRELSQQDNSFYDVVNYVKLTTKSKLTLNDAKRLVAMKIYGSR